MNSRMEDEDVDSQVDNGHAQ